LALVEGDMTDVERRRGSGAGCYVHRRPKQIHRVQRSRKAGATWQPHRALVLKSSAAPGRINPKRAANDPHKKNTVPRLLSS
jgi:hypothetical protein